MVHLLQAAGGARLLPASPIIGSAGSQQQLSVSSGSHSHSQPAPTADEGIVGNRNVAGNNSLVK